MKKIKWYIRIEKAIWRGIFVALLLVNLYCVLFFGLEVWNIFFFFLGIGMMTLERIAYAIIGNYYGWIEISGTEINLVNLKGELLIFSAGEIVKVVYGIMRYKLYFWHDGEELVIQCPSNVKVRKNGKHHRGIWLEDFPQAKFEDG